MLSFKEIKKRIKSLLKKNNGIDEKNLSPYLKKYYDNVLWERIIESINDSEKSIFEKKIFLETVLNFLIKDPLLIKKESTYATLFICLSLLDFETLQKEYSFILSTYDTLIDSNQTQKIIAEFVVESRKSEQALTDLDSYICKNFFKGVNSYINELLVRKNKGENTFPYSKDTNLVLNIFVAFCLVFMNLKFKKMEKF